MGLSIIIDGDRCYTKIYIQCYEWVICRNMNSKQTSFDNFNFESVILNTHYYDIKTASWVREIL